MKKYYILTVVLCILAFAGCSDNGTEPKKDVLFPLKEGNTWIYLHISQDPKDNYMDTLLCGKQDADGFYIFQFVEKYDYHIYYDTLYRYFNGILQEKTPQGIIDYRLEKAEKLFGDEYAFKQWEENWNGIKAEGFLVFKMNIGIYRHFIRQTDPITNKVYESDDMNLISYHLN